MNFFHLVHRGQKFRFKLEALDRSQILANSRSSSRIHSNGKLHRLWKNFRQIWER